MSDNINQDITIGGEGNIVVGRGNVIINPLPPAEALLRRNLAILLKNIETTWIKGVLHQSVHHAALLELGMELREEAVDDPWRMVLEGPDQSRETLPRGRKIKDIFYEANGLLLILGEPGSGKTTTLLQLARDLIAEIDQAFTQPVPVILNLSTWTDKQQPLDEWLIAELNSKYRLPKKDGQSWLRERRILPLLDGLDEVRAENRAACVEKINRLVTDYGLQGLIVCSRIKDYTDLNIRLAFYRALYIQPLTPEQVDEYLDQAGDKLASLRAILQSDNAINTMAQSPLILNIMSLAYQNTSAEDLSDPAWSTDKARRRHLLDKYVARMFGRRAGARPYDDQQTRQRLSWLAGNLQRHNQEVFQIEGLQPSWLSVRHLRWIYFLFSRMVGGMVLGLSIGLSFGLSDRLALNFLLPSGGIGLIAGMSIGILDVLRFEWLRKQGNRRKLPIFWWSVINFVAVWLVSGLIVVWIIALQSDWIAGLAAGLVMGLLFGLLFGVRSSRQNPDIDIGAVEALHWSWRKGAQGGLTGGLIGLILGLIGGFIVEPADGLMTRLVTGLIFISYSFLMGVMLNGLQRQVIETKSVPNEGIRLSIRNAIFRGLPAGVLIGLLSGLPVWLIAGDVAILNNLLIFGPLFGLIGMLWYGGLDVIQHYTLRLLLVMQRSTPANYGRFLDYAVERIFLQKVGGGYRFIHRLLLEHFAEMRETTKNL